jgi:hypothetical protein
MTTKQQESHEYTRMLQQTKMAETAFWNGSPTRQEVQNAFNEHAQLMNTLSNVVTRIDVVASFLAEKFGVRPEDVQGFVQRKNAEAEAAKQSAVQPEGDNSTSPEHDGDTCPV